MPIEMVTAVRRGNPLARARSLAHLARARRVHTGRRTDTGHVKALFARHGLAAPPAGAVVHSTLGLVAIVAGSDFAGLLPRQIASHPTASRYLDVVATREGPYEAELAAMARTEAMASPAVRHFLAHLHRAAHHVGRAG